jgi:3-hydroxybutyryl-CoA dehydrogenase
MSREIKNVVVVGAGSMGVGIAQNFAEAGLSVKMLARHQETLDNAMVQLTANLKLFQEFQLLRQPPAEIKSRVTPVLAKFLSQEIQRCDFVLETVPEILQQKKEILSQLDSCSPDVIISSNTGSFTISMLTEGMKTPERVVGTHYFMPAHIIPLVEIHRSTITKDEVVEATIGLMKKVGKKTVLVRKESTGFIVNRIQAAIAREAHYLIEQGIVTPEDFDTATKASYGFRLANIGPMAQADINGLDTVFRGNSLIYKVLCTATEPSPVMTEKVKNGEFGLKSGKGFYDYTGKSKLHIMEEYERNLLKQLVLFHQRENK